MDYTINNFDEFKKIINHEPYYGEPILPYTQNDDINELNDYFNNKSVCIVGPAPNLIDKNKGEEIDNYDIVCKVGQMYNMNDSLNYGKRMDVLFNGCFVNIEPIEKYLNKNIKKVITPIKPCMPGILDIHKRDLWNYYNYLKKNIKLYENIDFYNVGIISCLFDNEINTRATLGTFSINFLLKQNLNKLGIYGFTWYQNGLYHPEYGQDYFCSHGVTHDLEKTLLKKKIEQTKFPIYLNNEVKQSLYKTL